ncbi:hypothetical protein [Solirubrum puertoriconensis]|nr:hypothetical protein [Solirubrum puertoriconensis]
MEDRREAVFQLSHEMLHVLVTDGQTKTTNNLEEGVATHFSVLMTEDYALDRAYAERIIPNTAYAHPHKLIQELLAIEPDAIVRLRKVQPNLGLVTADDFDKAGLHSVPAALIQELIKLIDYSHPSQPTQ